MQLPLLLVLAALSAAKQPVPRLFLNKEAPSSYQRDASTLLRRALKLQSAGRAADAAGLASRSLVILPNNPDAYDVRGSALLELGKPREAIEDFNRAIELDPKNAYAFYERAGAEAALGDKGGAQRDFDRAVQLGGLHFDAPAKAAKVQPAKAAPPGSAPLMSSWSRVLFLLGCTLIGGVLIAFGLVEVSARRKSRPDIADLGSRFRIDRHIGLGGMGIVYEAFDCVLGRPVAIKRMRDEVRLDPHERARFLEEARIVAALKHPSIVEIHTILEAPNDLALVFEYVAGETLAQQVRARGRLPFEEAKRIILGVGRALQHAHGQGVVHRDLKPSNIMLAKDGRVKVMDFGVARQAKDAINRAASTQFVVGTPDYMAPEARQGIIRRESDIFALGVCLYEMLCGQPPRQRRQAISPAVDAFLFRALDPEPDNRFRTVAEFIASLEAIRA